MPLDATKFFKILGVFYMLTKDVRDQILSFIERYSLSLKHSKIGYTFGRFLQGFTTRFYWWR